MKRNLLFYTFLIIMTLALAIGTLSCFADEDGTTTTKSSKTSSASVIIPSPEVVKVVASTSGTESSYYVTLDIKVKNNGADGIILITAQVTQGYAVQEEETTVFLKQNAEYEYKITFPLEWKGGEFETDVTATLP